MKLFVAVICAAATAIAVVSATPTPHPTTLCEGNVPSQIDASGNGSYKLVPASSSSWSITVPTEGTFDLDLNHSELHMAYNVWTHRTPGRIWISGTVGTSDAGASGSKHGWFSVLIENGSFVSGQVSWDGTAGAVTTESFIYATPTSVAPTSLTLSRADGVSITLSGTQARGCCGDACQFQLCTPDECNAPTPACDTCDETCTRDLDDDGVCDLCDTCPLTPQRRHYRYQALEHRLRNNPDQTGHAVYHFNAIPNLVNQGQFICVDGPCEVSYDPTCVPSPSNKCFFNFYGIVGHKSNPATQRLEVDFWYEVIGPAAGDWKELELQQLSSTGLGANKDYASTLTYIENTSGTWVRSFTFEIGHRDGGSKIARIGTNNANDKNDFFGMSGWTNIWHLGDAPSTFGYQGDVNIDLFECPNAECIDIDLWEFVDEDLDSYTWRVGNHPDGSAAPPEYGVRFDNFAASGPYTFDTEDNAGTSTWATLTITNRAGAASEFSLKIHGLISDNTANEICEFEMLYQNGVLVNNYDIKWLPVVGDPDLGFINCPTLGMTTLKGRGNPIMTLSRNFRNHPGYSLNGWMKHDDNDDDKTRDVLAILKPCCAPLQCHPMPMECTTMDQKDLDGCGWVCDTCPNDPNPSQYQLLSPRDVTTVVSVGGNGVLLKDHLEFGFGAGCEMDADRDNCLANVRGLFKHSGMTWSLDIWLSPGTPSGNNIPYTVIDDANSDSNQDDGYVSTIAKVNNAGERLGPAYRPTGTCVFDKNAPSLSCTLTIPGVPSLLVSDTVSISTQLYKCPENPNDPICTGPDSDNDGAPDACDNCPYVYNPADGNGVQPDYCTCPDTGASLGLMAECFNVITEGDMTGLSSDSEGRVMVGGSASLSNYLVNHAVPMSAFCPDVAIVVDDHLGWTHGQAQNGDARAGELWLDNVSVDPPHQATEILGNFGNGYIDNLVSGLTSLNNDLCAVPDASTAEGELKWGSVLELKLYNPQWNIFRVSAADLSAATSLQVLNNGQPSTATVIILIDGAAGVIEIANMGLTLPQRCAVLYVACDATALHIHGVNLDGNVLAPTAPVFFSNAQHNGMMVAKSLHQLSGQTSTGQFNWVPPCLCIPDLDNLPTPPTVAPPSPPPGPTPPDADVAGADCGFDYVVDPAQKWDTGKVDINNQKIYGCLAHGYMKFAAAIENDAGFRAVIQTPGAFDTTITAAWEDAALSTAPNLAFVNTYNTRNVAANEILHFIFIMEVTGAECPDPDSAREINAVLDGGAIGGNCKPFDEGVLEAASLANDAANDEAGDFGIGLGATGTIMLAGVGALALIVAGVAVGRKLNGSTRGRSTSVRDTMRPKLAPSESQVGLDEVMRSEGEGGRKSMRRRTSRTFEDTQM